MIFVPRIYVYMQSAELGLVKMLRKNKDRTKLKRKEEYNIQREGTRTNIRREKRKKKKEEPTCTTSLHLKESWCFASTPTSFL